MNNTNNAFQQPMFAPVTQGPNTQLGDDIDLNEIFADYFATEFEDPLNAYTSSMANYSGAAAAVALAQKQQQAEAAQAPAPNALPTGGIKTAWHAGSLPNVGNGSVLQQQPQQQMQQAPAHTQKKIRVEPQGQAPASGVSGRLGFSMVGGHLAVPQTGAAPVPVPAAKTAASPGSVPLPVGVGIRLGGVGGVAPATAQQSGIPRPAAQGQYMMWGGMPGGMPVAGMSEHAVAERRQRNREHAKRSRVRKKFMLESLQEQVRQLQKENTELRMVVQERIPQHAQQIISECCSKNPLFADVDLETGKNDAKKETNLVQTDFSLISSLTSGQQNFVLSDPRLPDNPIVYASEGFYALTGYSREEVLGRNCRFLQGPGTDPRSVDIIRTAIANGSDATTCILNYRADGTPFWNQFFVAALRDADNCIVNFVGVQCEVEPEAGGSVLEEKVNSVLPLQNKGDDN